MALQLIDGFDHYNSRALMQLKGWTVGGNIDFPAGRLGGQAMDMSGNGTDPGSPIFSNVKILPGSFGTLIAGFAFQWLSGGSAPIFSFAQPGGTVAQVYLDLGTRFLSIKNPAGTVVATGTHPLVQNTWNYIEVKIVVGASGSCELHLNGVPGEIPSTVGNFGTTNIDRVLTSVQSNNAGVTYRTYFDDMYVLDPSGPAPRNTFLGDTRVETLYPSADGAHSAWTPSSGTAHFSLVNDNPPDGDTSYVADATPGDVDTYQFGDLTLVTGTIFGAQTNLYARKDDANARVIAPVIRQAGVDYLGVNTPALSTSYNFYSQIYNQDPTGTDWTIATVNADEYGVKEIS